MYIVRAKCNCPMCYKEEEVWYYKNVVQPFSSLQCFNCGHMYEASRFTTAILELRSKNTVSAVDIAANIKEYLHDSTFICNI